MSITISLMYYDKNKNGDIIECGNTKAITYKNFITPYPEELFIELKEKFPLKTIIVYDSEGENRDLYEDSYILDKINETKKEDEILLYNLNIIKEFIEIKINSPSYSNNENISIEIDYYYI